MWIFYLYLRNLLSLGPSTVSDGYWLLTAVMSTEAKLKLILWLFYCPLGELWTYFCTDILIQQRQRAVTVRSATTILKSFQSDLSIYLWLRSGFHWKTVEQRKSNISPFASSHKLDKSLTDHRQNRIYFWPLGVCWNEDTPWRSDTTHAHAHTWCSYHCEDLTLTTDIHLLSTDLHSSCSHLT